MSSENKTNEGKLYVMPKVSVVLQEGRYGPVRSYGYSYARREEEIRRSPFSFIVSAFTAFVGFFLVVAIFAIPVSVTSVLLISTMNSQGIVTIRTQDIPSDGYENRYVPEKAKPPVVPADK